MALTGASKKAINAARAAKILGTKAEVISGGLRGIKNSTKDFGVPTLKFKDCAESASKSGMCASGRRVGTEPSPLLRSGKLKAKDFSDTIPEGASNTQNPFSGTTGK